MLTVEMLSTEMMIQYPDLFRGWFKHIEMIHSNQKNALDYAWIIPFKDVMKKWTPKQQQVSGAIIATHISGVYGIDES